ncbi:MAG TPA: hypothetical protein VF622_09480, partial [Segetibacter sp.]
PTSGKNICIQTLVILVKILLPRGSLIKKVMQIGMMMINKVTVKTINAQTAQILPKTFLIILM